MDSLATAPVSTAPPTAIMYGPIVHDLSAVDRIFQQTVAATQPALVPLIDQLRQYTGKRLRPVLLLLTAKACGDVTHEHHVLGAVVEMIHTATLVHDDVLDEAGIRRHSATVNAEWGNKTSILLGDYLFTHAFHLTSTLGEARACQIIGEATNRVCEGELRQTVERGNLDLGEEDYLKIIDGKTAALTACCCRLGALYANAASDVVEAMANYGRLLGMAFQIADDLLDVTGTQQRAGKTLGTDIEQQKLTLPLIYMLDRVPASDAERLRQVLRSPNPEKFAAIKDALEATHSVRDARRRAEELARNAAAELAFVPISPARDILSALTHWVISREM